MPTKPPVQIHRIVPEMLEERFLAAVLYPDLEHTHYWTSNWHPDFYIALARAGFISVSTDAPNVGRVLIPELQEAYAVLDWEHLHESRNLRRLRRSAQLQAEHIELRIADDGRRVVSALLAYHRENNWLCLEYRRMLEQLSETPRLPGRFSLRAIELWATTPQDDRDPAPRLIAGEIGYTIGSVYTSLSGFSARHEPRYADFGTLQIVLLAEALRENGFAFWNMGHTSQPYKLAVGAKPLPRAEFLERWIAVRDDTSATLPEGTCESRRGPG